MMTPQHEFLSRLKYLLNLLVRDDVFDFDSSSSGSRLSLFHIKMMIVVHHVIMILRLSSSQLKSIEMELVISKNMMIRCRDHPTITPSSKIHNEYTNTTHHQLLV